MTRLEEPEARGLPSEGELAAHVERAAARLRAAGSLAELDGLEPELVGRRSPFLAWRHLLGSLPPAKRPAAGDALNRARGLLVELAATRRRELEAAAAAERERADRLDLTEVLPAPGPGHLHVVHQVREELEDIFVGMGYEVAEGPEVETDWYNFTALNMPRHHPARSIQDSFYLAVGDGETYLLRSQTSPVQIRLLERGRLPIYAVAPGRVYRRDTADARHLSVFHQIEGLVVDAGVSFADLAGTIDTFVKAIFGTDVAARLRPAYFPFTEPSAEFEVSCAICRGTGCRTCGQTGWIELGGCGMVHPAVFEATGVDPEAWSGFAFGFGIDRLAAMRHEIADLRSLIENDVRFLAQF
ncbi:MAG TPA: phenylalanine--tRNA ligase subunit alpha [Acidimicrobiales bacterium]|nr:phenylalanine--tRNA ligase subunit alpha [Acidimicrobiales bacterium]